MRTSEYTGSNFEPKSIMHSCLTKFLEPNFSEDQNVDELKNVVLITKINDSYIFLPY